MNPGLAVPLLGYESGLPNSSAFSLASALGALEAKKDLLSGEENPGLAVPLLGYESGLPNSSAFSLASVGL